MEPSGYVMMTIVLAGVWGGFIYLLYQASRH
jgi:hypothetical protein